jgi:ABC-type polysaccharide/polyol phosphate export permease
LPPTSPWQPTHAESVYDSARRPPAVVAELAALWRYRDLVVQLVRRDVVARYKRSMLGVAWTLLNPLGLALILTAVFSGSFASIPAYAAYVLTGLLAWNFFAQSTQAAVRQLIWGSGLLQRIYLPRTVFAVTAVGTGLVNLILATPAVLLVMALVGIRPGPALVVVPYALALLAAFALGWALALSTLAIRFTDIADLYGMLLPAVFYLTPIIYPADILPAGWGEWVLLLNPVHHLIALYRDPLHAGAWPGLGVLAGATATALLTLAMGWTVFARRAHEIPYHV